MTSLPGRTARPLAGLAAFALTAGAFAAPAHAAAPALPTAPQRAEQNGGGVRLHTNAELAKALKRIERASHGRVRVRSVGKSNEGRPLWFATLGSGPKRLMYVTEQHGDEPLGTESALKALGTLGVRNDRDARRLRSKITLGILVRANPDGHQRQWRYNYDPDAKPEYGEPGKGYDINRYHNPSMRPADNPVPEAAAIRRTFDRFRPSIMVDYHMQGRYAFPPPDGREITTSILWPTNPTVPAGAFKRSKQVGVRVHNAFTRAGAVVSQYPGGDYEGIARNAYGILGGASLLVELSNLPPERQRFQVHTAYVSMVDLAKAAAYRQLDRIDPADADKIPLRGPALPGSNTTHAEHDHDA
ncbi:M14 family zinc carboxypeptidase [Actinomadura rudentiformis]|uniref:Peptidase M14 n=1 Tax=Actinomadura rudentiformis TaxID=359158 RepID=A0A6H9YH67_9ACTN|nr:M14 family zinc carboxypeptidase [Actinomadura rudentiformis]KAB2344391.1 peptidase M14 [Actinomadura rudentiformis]